VVVPGGIDIAGVFGKVISPPGYIAAGKFKLISGTDENLYIKLGV